MYKRIKEIKFVFLFFILSFCFANHVFASTSISSDISEDTTWALSGSPYIIENSISINTGATLTIEAGVVIKVKDSYSFFKNTINVSGKILANGTENNKIYFTSYFDDLVESMVDDEEYCYAEEYDEEDNPIGPEICETYDTGDPFSNDWKGFYFNNTDGSVLNHVVLRYGGTDPMLFYNSDVSLQNIEIQHSKTGVTLYNNSHIDLLGGDLNNLEKDALVVFNNSSVNFDDIKISDVLDDPVSVFNNSSLIGEMLKVGEIDTLNNLDVIAVFNNSDLSLKNSSFKDCPSASCITIFDGMDYLNTPSSLNIEKTVFDGGFGSGLVLFGGSEIATSIKDSLFKDFSLFAIKNYNDFVVNAEDNDWNHASGPYHQSLNVEGLGEQIYGNVDFDPWIGQEEPTPEIFYAKIKDAPNGILSLYESPRLEAVLVKTLPNDFIVKIIKLKNDDNTQIVADGFEWAKIVDPTDDTKHYTQYKKLDADLVYLPYLEDKQENFKNISETQITTLANRREAVINAVDNYYNNSRTTKSLYNSDDSANLYHISKLKDAEMPKELILAILAQESGSVNFNNENVSFDYGHGITQVTFHSYKDYLKNKIDPRGISSLVRLQKCKNIIRDVNDKYIRSSEEYKNCYKGLYNSSGKLYVNDYDNYTHDISKPKYKQYSNTKQSVYANVKDGLSVLASKYGVVFNHFCSQSITISNLIFSCDDLKILKAVWGYNGATLDPKFNYMRDVSNKLKNLSNYFPGINYENSNKLIEKLIIANNNRQEIKVHSPVFLQVEDVLGNITDIENTQIPNSYYDGDKEALLILFPENTYTYKVVGDDTGGAYGLDIDIFDDSDEPISFRAVDLPITPNEVHTYKVDEEKLKNNQPNAVSVSIDQDGDGVSERTIYSGNTLTSLDQAEVVSTSGISSNNVSGVVGLQFLINNTPPKPMVLSAQISNEEEIKPEIKEQNIQKKVVKKVTINKNKKVVKTIKKQNPVSEIKAMSLQAQTIDSEVKTGWFRRLLKWLFNF